MCSLHMLSSVLLAEQKLIMSCLIPLVALDFLLSVNVTHLSPFSMLLEVLYFVKLNGYYL